MFERYREDAKRAIYFARWEAEQSGAASIEPKHILLALTHDADSRVNQLFSLSAPAENFRGQLRPHPSAKFSPSVGLPLSNASKRVLAYATQEADKLVSKPIGTEHLLLGLLREKSSDVLAALASVGIDLHSARNRVREDRGLPTLGRKPDGKETPLKSLRPFGALMLLILVLLMIYAIFRLVFP